MLLRQPLFDIGCRFRLWITLIQVLHDEMQALQLELMQRQTRITELEAENKSLVERWLKKLNDEANKINEANRIAEECVRAVVLGKSNQRRH